MTVVTDAAGLDLGQYLRRSDHIVMGQACGEPTTLVEALIAQGAGIGDLSAFIATSFSGLLTPDAADSFALSSMGAIGALRTMAAAHKLGIIPCHVGQIGPMIADGIIGCDVAFVQVSPADSHGNHSFGLIADHVAAAVAKARVVIAEVNDQVPFVYGDGVLPSSKIDVAVHVSHAPVEVAPAKIGPTDEAIAGFIANYVEDGSVLQTGVGAVPDAVLRLRPQGFGGPFGDAGRWSGRFGRGRRRDERAQAHRHRRVD
jgi:acyl-CoA hydrolase